MSSRYSVGDILIQRGLLHIALPKILRDALKKLASAQEVRDIEHLLNAALEHVNTDENSAPINFPEGPTLDMDWKEGVEDLANLTKDELWTALGFEKEKTLPFFQEFTDPDAAINPWSEEGEKWLGDTNSAREPLRPRWHQLVGIFRMLQRAFDGMPVLLMDGVGIGKTFQVIGFLACLAYYHRFYAKNSKFPGHFGMSFPSLNIYITYHTLEAGKKWQGKDGNIPSQPFIISCPVNLHSQWTRELERFLKRHSFDILPYIGKLATRGDWWDKILTQSLHQPHHRIILATESVSLRPSYFECSNSELCYQAIQDDASVIFVDFIRDVEGNLRKSVAYASRAKKTIYGRDYLGLIIDEAHVARKFNKIHTAYYALRKQSLCLVAMTATPVMTKLQVSSHGLYVVRSNY